MGNRVDVLSNSLFDGISCDGIVLNRHQISRFPQATQKKVQKSYSQFLQDPAVQNIVASSAVNKPMILSLKKGSFSFQQDTDRCPYLRSVRALDYPDMLRTMSRLKDEARVFAPEAIREQSSFQYPVRETKKTPTNHSSPIEWVADVKESNSFIGNTYEMFERNSPILNVSSVLGKGLGVVDSTHALYTHAHSLWSAQKCDDREGITKAALLGTAEATELMGAASSAVLGTAGSWFALGTGALVMASALHSLHVLPTFRNNLHHILERKDISLQKRAELGILFLQQQIALTESDIRDIQLKFSSQEEREAAKIQKLEEKWDRFIRRVGAECVQKVAVDSNQLLEKVRNGDTKEALELLQLACHQSSVKIRMQAILLCVALLAIIASSIALIAGSFVGSTVLFALSAIGAFSAALKLLLNSSYIQHFGYDAMSF